MSPRFRPSNSSPPRWECPRAGWRLGANMANEPRTIKGPCFAIHAGKNIGGTGRSPDVDVGLMLQIASDAGSRWGGLPYREMSKKEMRDLIDKTIAEIAALSSSIVAVANISHVLPKRPSGIEGWHMPDSFGWVLGNVRVLSPIACRGSQGLWEPSHLVYASIQRQIAGIA